MTAHPMTATKTHTLEPWVEIIRRKVGAMRFGSVQLTIHEGRVTQVEATEKVRLPVEPGAAFDSRGATTR